MNVHTAETTKILKRLMPFLLLMYALSFLDRANVGYAKTMLEADIGISDAAYAFGAGLFFIGYALFEVPSNLIMHRVGAKIWMCRIMVTWGLLSAAMALVNDATTFYVVRFLLGVAEAGFFPGVILYLTYWIPAEERGRALGLFYFGAPLALMLGGPISGSLLELDGLGGYHGWQWMFLVEGLLASLVGIWAFFYLDNAPRHAKWLSDDEKRNVAARLDAEESAKEGHTPHSLAAAFRDARLLYLCLIYMLIQISVYGVIFYLPSQVGAIVDSEAGLLVGLVSAVPWLCAIAATYTIPRLSDRRGERRLIASATMFAAGLGIALSVYAGSPVIALIALCVAASGFIAVQPLFWAFPTAYLSGKTAAGGIALVNSLGALGGFIAPNLKVWGDVSLATTNGGLYLLAITTLIGAGLIFLLKPLGLTGLVPTERQTPHSAPRQEKHV